MKTEESERESKHRAGYDSKAYCATVSASWLNRRENWSQRLIFTFLRPLTKNHCKATHGAAHLSRFLRDLFLSQLFCAGEVASCKQFIVIRDSGNFSVRFLAYNHGMHEPEDILNFWSYEIGRERWFLEDAALDRTIAVRFQDTYEQAVAGKLKAWESTPEGMLALMLLLDQFPRRMFRGTSKAFATDEMAVDLARSAIIKHFDDRIDKQYKLLFYLPFLNSEDVGDQHLALFYIRERTKDEDWLKMAEQNCQIVQNFGRFPQRNPILGREPTPEEAVFLQRASQGNA